jgi:hypothetical protein
MDNTERRLRFINSSSKTLFNQYTSITSSVNDGDESTPVEKLSIKDQFKTKIKQLQSTKTVFFEPKPHSLKQTRRRSKTYSGEFSSISNENQDLSSILEMKRKRCFIRFY